MTAALAPSDLLGAWEWGLARHPVDRALVLLWAADPSLDAADLAALPIGERDRRLLAMRRSTFGDALGCVVACPRCEALQEFTVSAEALLAAAKPAGEAPDVLGVEGYTVHLRRLDSRDVAAAAGCADVESAEALLLARAVVSAEERGTPVRPERLPAALQQGIAERLALQDPAADLTFDLACASCGERWDGVFDVSAFLWSEVEAEARRLLGEVATLAQRYGWREADILAMTPLRRRAYVEVAGTA
jgi:hypothetical protein